MAAYLIADIEVTNPEGFKKYQEAVPATIAKHGGKYLVRGGEVEPKEGDWTPTRMVVLEFPNMATLKKWYIKTLSPTAQTTRMAIWSSSRDIDRER